MKLCELVMALCQRLELTDPQLLQRARASWNPDNESLDGCIAELILDQIRSVLPKFDDGLKRYAYNEIADSEGLNRIDQDDTDFDSWIHEALLDPVIDMLMVLDSGVSLIH